MKKISFVTQNLAPFRVYWLDELAKYYDITIFHNYEYVHNVSKNYISCCPIKAKEIIIKKKLLGFIPVYLFNKILENKADIIIIDGYGFLSQMAFIFILKWKGIPYILSADGGFVKKEGKIKYWLKHRVIADAAAYLSTSKITDQFLAHYGANNNKIYRHYLTSLYDKDIRRDRVGEEEKYRIRKKRKISQTGILVVSIGRFIPIKGFDTLLSSMRYVKDDITLILIGGKPTKEYRRAAEKKNPGKIRFLEFVDKETVLEYLDAADIFAFPSRGDTWGLVIGEAMARGLPVISTRECIAAASLIKNGENGYVIPSDDDLALSEKINFLSEKKELREEMGKANIQKIKKYTFESIAEMDHAILEKFDNNIFGD